MDRQERFDMETEEHMIGQLGALSAAAAPPSLLPTVMSRVGLGDGYWRLDTPVGAIFIAYNGEGISAVMRAANEDEFETAFRAQFGRNVYRVERPPQQLMQAVMRHLQGDRRTGLRFDLRGISEFERAVLQKALEIPRGQIRPYSWIAREIGRPRAVRAVGSALGANPIPLLIPCHRVVRSDGRIGEYGMGGTEVKRALLDLEGARPDEVEQLARAGVRYFGSDTTHIYCFPTCSHARRTTDRHRVTFRSEGEALAAGYRPCRVCRPAVAS